MAGKYIPFEQADGNGFEQRKETGMSAKPCRERKPKSFKQKPSLLCVNFSDEARFGVDFTGYLKHRLGGKFKYGFKVQSTETFMCKQQRNTRVVLSFPSKAAATKARDYLKNSNKHSSTKLLCYFPEDTERESVVLNASQTQSRFERHLQIIFDKSTESLESHEVKINEKRVAQEKLESKLKCGKLSLIDFECNKSELKAIEDKLAELYLQRNEFRSYTDSVYEKVEKIKNNVKFEKKMNELRTEFGLESSRLRNALPIYARRSDIIDTVNQHQVCVILGETGSGKSTQLPQYLYQAGYAKTGLLACTQPRKIAAITLASHVAREMASNVGQTVGYHVGMKAKKTGITKVVYMTDHILLNECLKDNQLKMYSCIIIDEAHERSIFTDLLLGMIKSALTTRPDLKIIITSATINPDIFVSYFGGPQDCPVVRVSGRTFPVETIWQKSEDDENPFDDYMDAAIKTALNLHKQNPPEAGDILVFLTNPLETEKCCEQFTERCHDNNCQCLPLHGKLQAEEQAKVFQDNLPNKRKVVFATNCAETSITIPGVRFVVDTGLVKEMRFDPKRNISSLRVYPVSKSSAEQRKGRAGRTSPGKCYRLYNEAIYNSMEEGSKPEILRVHLGQALLKLMELGVDPLLFDFVESPGEEAMECAVVSLGEIGAVEGRNITAVGRWISKLPLEPLKGFLVQLGIQEGIPMEALIVASSAGGDIFFRHGSEEEKRGADIKKLQFCHSGGDILTKLNVYRKWDQVEERRKGKWCVENSINGKSMKAIRETVNEIRTILKNDTTEDIRFTLKPAEHADIILKKLLVRVYKQNVCFFLGHEKAGFFSVQNNQHVQVHPSSVLKPLNLQPEVIVFEQILQTSKDFVTNVTPVLEFEMSELSLGVLQSYKNTIESLSVSLVKTFCVGQKILKKFIGPLHKNRKETEEMLNESCQNKTVVVDINKASGEILLFASKVDTDLMNNLLTNVLRDLTKPLKQQCIELNVGKVEGVRVVLGAGCRVIDVLMPHQYRTIVVKQKLQSDKELEMCDVEATFSPFGEIMEIKQFSRNRKDPRVWGSVTYESNEKAREALLLFTASEDRYLEAFPSLPKTQQAAFKEFKVKITWWRRPAKGIAYVTMDWPEDFVSAMSHRSVIIDTHRIYINAAKSKAPRDTTNQLFLKGLPFDITEDKIKAGLGTLLGIPDKEINTRIKGIIVPRENVETSGVMYDALYTKIEREALVYAHVADFDISFLKDPRKNPKCISYTVFICFKNPDEGQAAINGMTQNAISFGSYPAQITAEIETSIAIRKHVFEAVKDEIEPAIKFIVSTNPTIVLKINTSKAGNIFINIKAADARELARVRVMVHQIIQGDVLECRRSNEISRLFTRDGCKEVAKIGKETGTVIFVDYRTMTITIQGTQENRTLSLTCINQYLDELVGLVEKLILLKGERKPRGLMKEIVIKYGNDLDQLKQASGVKFLKLDYLNHKITALGEETAVAEIEKLIQNVSDHLQNNLCHNIADIPDCSVCFCPVEPADMYRLECCGHPYCYDCIEQQIKSSIQHKTFPVVCASENCGEPFVIEDINSLIRKGYSTQSELMKSAVNCFIRENNFRFRYCITPDCAMVYGVTAVGAPFTCTECHHTLCTACHIQYHNGLSCSMYRAEMKDQNKIDSWLRKDSVNRKLCPKCTTPIEKTGGCNHLTCGTCRIHICWVCMKIFQRGPDCYGHLATEHGPIV